jgi:hypothetical protein
MADTVAVLDHKAWLGYLQPEGLVVSPAALADAQVYLDRNAGALQQAFVEQVEPATLDDAEVDRIAYLPIFVTEFLGWPQEALLGIDADHPVPDALQVPLPEIGETLAPTMVVLEGLEADAAPMLLVQEVDFATELDAVTTGDQAGWSASPSQRLERLLRETGVPLGLLTNLREFRLIYAPRGESAGTLTFPVAFMRQVAGRPIVGALHMLLSAQRLFTGARDARLPALLGKSREYQSQVSTKLAGQVLDALYELLRGFEAANARARGQLLGPVLQSDPDHVYAGLLSVLMRLVFLLYAEDRGLMPNSSLYNRNYSVHALFEQLRADAERFPDIMDQRYGAWARLISLFRTVHNGCRHPDLAMPSRRGHLFDPARYPFLEGGERQEANGEQRMANGDGASAGTQTPVAGRCSPFTALPLISDGCLQRVLRKLLLLDGERLSYRTLDVEEIGSVYQTIMGFKLHVAEGASIATVGKRKHKSEVPAPIVVNLEELLALKAADRTKWLKERTGHDWDGAAAQQVRGAATVDELLVALGKRIAANATPHPAPKGGLALQPTDERRRTGSHYTPRKLTEPIVRKTLEPVLMRLGEAPTPEQILDLRICDIAMGSGAFLVEGCRQLADVLVAAWRRHGGMPPVPLDEDEVLLARRLVAQRCLYGVDKNPMAVDLAKLSLWLATLAKDHPFTFLDHSFRAGDSLVGLTRKQIVGFTWETEPKRADLAFGQGEIAQRVARAAAARTEILQGGEQMDPELKRRKLALAEDAVGSVRLYGDLVVAAFFGSEKPKGRDQLRSSYLDDVVALLQGRVGSLPRLLQARAALASGDHGLVPFHWEVEFPEVFAEGRPGFDAIVGNPPFLGGKQIATALAPPYAESLKALYSRSRGAADLAAFFFRRAFDLLVDGGAMGLLATNSIAETATRTVAMDPIVADGGTIYHAQTDFPWPGEAAVTLSQVSILKGRAPVQAHLDGVAVAHITSSLTTGLNLTQARRLKHGIRCTAGTFLFGRSFVLEPGDLDAARAANPGVCSYLRVFVNGDVLNGTPDADTGTRVVDFGELDRAQIEGCDDFLVRLVSAVRDERKNQTRQIHEHRHWLHWDKRTEFYAVARQHRRIIACTIVSRYLAFIFVDPAKLFTHGVQLFADDRPGLFAVLQSRPHEFWAGAASSSLGRTVRYSTTTSFDTFALPQVSELAGLARAGEDYHAVRHGCMARRGAGTTLIYSLFHDPEVTDSDIIQLRELHEQMDRAVLDAYGWSDIPTACDFFLEYDDEEDEAAGKPSRRKKPWRYRWPDDVRDEVLARLLDLNARRAEEERLTGAAAATKGKGKGRGRSKATGGEDDGSLGGLFG